MATTNSPDSDVSSTTVQVEKISAVNSLLKFHVCEIIVDLKDYVLCMTKYNPHYLVVAKFDSMSAKGRAQKK